MIFCGLVTSFLGSEAVAHQTSTASITLANKSGRSVDLELKLSGHDLAVALGMETDLVTAIPLADFTARQDQLAAYLTGRLRLFDQSGPCAAGPLALTDEQASGSLLISRRYLCPRQPQQLTLRYDLFFDIDANHRALGRFDNAGESESFLLDRAVSRLTFDLGQTTAESSAILDFPRILLFGVEHIVIGYDHVLFLIALLMVPGRFWDLVRIITAFTLAHSLTLALAWFDVLRLPSNLVEAAIALSIFYVAVDNIISKSFRRRWILAGTFGLLHGLGFYGVLQDSALAKSGALVTLVGFNLGVELGQLLILFFFLGPLYWWWRQPWYPVTRTVSCLALAAFAAWLTFSRLALV